MFIESGEDIITFIIININIFKVDNRTNRINKLTVYYSSRKK